MNLLRIAARLAALSQPLSDRPDYGGGGASVPRGETEEEVEVDDEQPAPEGK